MIVLTGVYMAASLQQLQQPAPPASILIRKKPERTLLEGQKGEYCFLIYAFYVMENDNLIFCGWFIITFQLEHHAAVIPPSPPAEAGRRRFGLEGDVQANAFRSLSNRSSLFNNPPASSAHPPPPPLDTICRAFNLLPLTRIVGDFDWKEMCRLALKTLLSNNPPWQNDRTIM